MRDQISTMRDEVASELQHEAGERVRIRVMRNADHLAYQEMLVDGLKGARVRNQNEILATLMQLRPEQLAQLIQSNDLDSFEELTHFGAGALAEDTGFVSRECRSAGPGDNRHRRPNRHRVKCRNDRTAALQGRVRSFPRSEVHSAAADPSGEKRQPADYRSAGGQPRQSFHF